MDYKYPLLVVAGQSISIHLLHTAMIRAASETSSASNQYLIAARQVHSALDYAIHQAEKMVAYPDLFDAVGPGFREHLHSSCLLCDQMMVPPNSCHIDCATVSRSTELGNLRHSLPTKYYNASYRKSSLQIL